MHASLLPAQQWAQLEFGLAQLRDARRTQRLVQIGEALAKVPSGTLPQAFPNWADLKGAYRFFSNPKIVYADIMSPHWERTRQSCCEPGEVLLVEDTTELDYSSHGQCQGLGQVGNQYGRGLHLHTNLALRVEGWNIEHCPQVTVVGVAGQQCWARPVTEQKKKKENWRQRLQRSRESERWAKTLAEMPARPIEARWIFLADRESDIYESFERALAARIAFLIRARCNRALAEEDQGVFDAVAQAAVLGQMEVEVRSRPGRTQRIAKLEVRAVTVSLRGVWRSGGRRPALTVQVVQAREINGPAGEEPIEWVLLTNLPVENFEAARRVVARYAQRWIIEEFHKALKSGTNIERSELESAEGLQNLLGVCVPIAVRLLNTKLLARAHPERAVDEQAFGAEALQILSARFGQPAQGWTYGPLLIAIARMGGFLARRHDGDPGWITIWRGWKRLSIMAEGAAALRTPAAINGPSGSG
jgi:hypothetical protein